MVSLAIEAWLELPNAYQFLTQDSDDVNDCAEAIDVFGNKGLKSVIS
jgi:hypothetical protein